MNEKHLCDTCTKHPATCDAEEIEWGIDRYTHSIGASADRVLTCDAYKWNEKPEEVKP